MTENRPFDHMLGYLARDGLPDADGLTGGESNAGADGTLYPVFARDADHGDLHGRLEKWRAAARAVRLARPEAPSSAPGGAGRPLVPSGLHQEFAGFALAMRAAGLTPGHP